MSKETIKFIVDTLKNKGYRQEEIALMLDVSIETLRRWIYRGYQPKPYQMRKITEIAKKHKISLN